MRSVSFVRFCCYSAVFLAVLQPKVSNAQQPITAIGITGSTSPTVTYNNVKAAGLRKPDGTLRSSWDSTGTSFTVKFNAPAASNINTVTQYTVNGIVTPVIKMPVNAIVKLRRLPNTYVNDTRNHYNFWATHSSVPAAGATSGTFNFTAPEVLSPEDAFLLNNITSGYDNIFENTINNLHASNIERLDFIIPEGLKGVSQPDLDNSGVAIFDRGVGDPFKIAAITAVNALNEPTAFGTLVPVAAANFGPSLLASSFDFCIITRDPKYYNQSRPSSPDIQNLRGVYISIASLGLAVNQYFYGYSLFANDVATANPDWTTYPNTTSTTSGLDPVNIMGLYKTTYSVLAVPMLFNAKRINNSAELRFTLYNKINNDNVVIERSADGNIFDAIDTVSIRDQGLHLYMDHKPIAGDNFYRLKLIDKDGTSGHSEIRKLRFAQLPVVNVYPNPATDMVRIGLPADWRNKRISIELIDVSGRTLHKGEIERSNPFELLSLDKYPRGYYVLSLKNRYDGSESRLKLILK
jgi:hypothetical protein